MAGVVEWFGFATKQISIGGLPALFDLSVKIDSFTQNDITNLYKKILTDVIQRTYGLNQEQMRSVWDNCLKSEASKGLLSLLAEAMFGQTDLFLVYKLKVIRKATEQERNQIEADYKNQNQSDVGVYVSFKDFTLTTMLKLYSCMEYSVLNSLNKKMNISNAIQFKMSDLRTSVGAVDKAQIEAQAKAICEAMGEGKNVLLDGKDGIETPVVEMETTKQSIAFLDGKRSFFTGLPIAYINGEQTTGIGSTGQADSKAIDRGLKYYFVSIIQPVCQALYGVEVTFKTEDTTSLDSALEAIKTFELIQSSTLLSAEEQRNIVRKLFNLDVETSRPV